MARFKGMVTVQGSKLIIHTDKSDTEYDMGLASQKYLAMHGFTHGEAYYYINEGGEGAGTKVGMVEPIALTRLEKNIKKLVASQAEKRDRCYQKLEGLVEVKREITELDHMVQQMVEEEENS